jgi:DNA-binding CsgD family transcriptional regulator
VDDVHRLAAGRVEPNPIGAPVVCASIAICGPTSATVSRFTDPGLARVGTSTVLGLPGYEPGEPDIHEVLGEMVNIIGGNLKRIVCDGEQEWALSLPVVRLLPTRSGADLTPRELDTLRQVARGGTSRAIATALGSTTCTVRNSVQSILGKLGAHPRLEAVTITVRAGIIDYPWSTLELGCRRRVGAPYRAALGRATRCRVRL